MNKKLYKASLCFILGAFAFLGTVGLAGCASSQIVNNQIPAWVSSPKSVYDEDKFLTYVGYGDDRNSAEIAALGGISAIFGRDVTVDTVTSKRMSEAVANGTVVTAQNREFSQDVQSKVNVDNLIGVEVPEYWFDGNNLWYAIAVLDKSKASAIYSSMIEKNSTAVDDLIFSARKDLYSLQSLCAYDFAQEIAIENKKNIDRLMVLDYDYGELVARGVILPEELARKKLEIAKEIPININIEGDIKGTYTSALLDALADFGFSGSTDENVRYVINGKVSYNYEVTTDGKTHKCYYDFESSLIDTKNGVNVFPINIRGRQAHRSVEEAENSAKQDINKKIESTFHSQFNDYLSSYISK